MLSSRLPPKTPVETSDCEQGLHPERQYEKRVENIRRHRRGWLGPVHRSKFVDSSQSESHRKTTLLVLPSELVINFDRPEWAVTVTRPIIPLTGSYCADHRPPARIGVGASPGSSSRENITETFDVSDAAEAAYLSFHIHQAIQSPKKTWLSLLT